jgi:HSP20 family protein
MNTLVKRNNQNPWLRDFFDVENIFGTNWQNWSGTNRSLPSVNISEDDKSFNVDVIAPGFKKEDFKINIEEDILTISAETQTENNEENKDKQYSRREYSHSSFTRSFRLPENAKDDAVSASYTDGILKLDIPKTENPIKIKKEIHIH